MADQIDTKVVGKLAEILTSHGLTELEYEGENWRICLTKESYTPQLQMPIVASQQPQESPSSQVLSQVDNKEQISEVSKTTEIDESKNPNALKSPMVGVVYLAPDTTKANYVKIGSLVAEGDTVCLIEAMKTFNPVKAHKGGRITKILVETGDPVEYGQPLVVIE